jgi:hypothetical protein
MKLLVTSFFVILAISVKSPAIDLMQIPENNAEALKQAIEAEGGLVEGEPYIATESGPDGKPVKLFVFPNPMSLVSLPETLRSSYWAMSGWVRIDEQPYGKSGGPIFGILFGRNDCVMALTADKWSKAGAPALMCGSVTLLTDVQIKESGSMDGGEWRKISLNISGNEWKMKIGDSFNQSGTVEGDTRGALERDGTLFLRVGGFAGAATFPELTEAQ